MTGYPRCARCDSFVPVTSFPAPCQTCGATLTGNVCRMCGRLGGWEFVDGACPTCFARTGPPIAAPRPRKTDLCKGCGSTKDRNDWTCPYCGYTQWGDIAFMAVFALVCFAVAAVGSQQSDALWRNVALWGGLILGGIFLAVTVSGVAGSLPQRRSSPQVHGTPVQPPAVLGPDELSDEDYLDADE